MIVLRSSLRYYIFNIVQCLVFVLLLIVLGWGYFHGQIPALALLVCGIWPIVLLGTAVLNIYRLQKTYVQLDEQTFQAQFRNESFHVLWKDILMIRMVGRFLECATKSNRYIIDLKNLNGPQILACVQQYAPQSAFAQDAFLQVPTYQQTLADYEAVLQEENSSVWAGYPHLAQTGRWLLFIGLLLPGILLLFGGNIGWVIPFIYIPFVVVIAGSIALRSLRVLEITPDKVIVNWRFWRRELDWDDIDRIKADFLYKNFVFYGKGKRLAAPGLQVWGQDNKKLYKMICARAWKHHIKLEDQNHRHPWFLLNNLPSSEQS